LQNLGHIMPCNETFVTRRYKASQNPDKFQKISVFAQLKGYEFKNRTLTINLTKDPQNPDDSEDLHPSICLCEVSKS